MRSFAFCVVLVAAFSISSCNWENVEIKSFAFHLEGRWESTDPTVYYGTLEITFDRITITGYYEGQTPIPGDNYEQRPFRNFIRNAPLVGFSEEGRRRNGRIEGLIFIEHLGILQEGIPYIWYEDLTQTQFLSFTFGGRDETLRRVEEPNLEEDPENGEESNNKRPPRLSD